MFVFMHRYDVRGDVYMLGAQRIEIMCKGAFLCWGAMIFYVRKKKNTLQHIALYPSVWYALIVQSETNEECVMRDIRAYSGVG